MKRSHLLFVLFIVVGVSLALTTSAVAFSVCKAEGTYRGYKDGFDEIAVLVTLVCHNSLCSKGSIWAQHDTRQIPTFQGDFNCGLGGNCNYTLFAYPRFESSSPVEQCWRTDGYFNFDKKNCAITFEETVQGGLFDDDCINGAGPFNFSGTIDKIEIGIVD